MTKLDFYGPKLVATAKVAYQEQIIIPIIYKYAIYFIEFSLEIKKVYISLIQGIDIILQIKEKTIVKIVLFRPLLKSETIAIKTINLV